MFNSMRKLTKLLYITLGLSMMFANLTNASPAFPGFVDFALDNGRTIKLAARGDEYFSWYESINGNVYIAKDGEVYFARFNTEQEVVVSAYTISMEPPADFIILNIQDPSVVSAIDKQANTAREAEMGEFGFLSDPHAHEGIFPPASTTALLTIAISFNDVQIIGSQQFWTNRVYQETNQFYVQASRGEFNFTSALETEGVSNDGLINVNLNQDHPNLVRASDDEVLWDAISQADFHIDFSQYDANNDGVISTSELNILFVFAGWESASSGEQYGPSVWAHVSSLSGSRTFDGLDFSMNYARVGEQHTTHLATMGIIAHELGHLTFNWPDLYDTSASNTDGNNALGIWCLMANGSWNSTSGQWSGSTPALPNPILRHWAGWETEQMSSGQHELVPTLDGGNALKIETEDAYHYAFVEAKQSSGYDAGLYLNNPGMLIWKHRSSGSNSTRNHYTGATQYPYITLTSNEANQDGAPGHLIYADQAIWPSTMGLNSIGTASSPNLHVSDGLDRNVTFLQAWDLTNIAHIGNGVVRFDSSKTTNYSPLMSLQAPTSAFSNTIVSFDGSAIRDQDGFIVEYQWQGPWGTQVTASPTFNYTFTTLGTQTITLTAIDNDGASNSISVEINIVDASAPPVAILNGYTSTTINLADNVSFTAFRSYDPKPNGGITSFRWIGPWGNYQAPPFFSHRFLAPGQFTVTLEVTDTLGNTAQDSVVITVVDDGVNLPPVAVLHDDMTMMLGQGYRFSSHASFDEDGVIASSVWEGPWGIREDSSAGFYYAFFELGVFSVTLTVTDNEGASHSDTQVFTVVEAQKQSTFDNVYLRGTSNNWSAGAMTLVADYTWEITTNFGSTNTERFKFDIYGDWSYNFGDTNGDGVVEPAGGDIYITQGSGNYRIRFNDQALSYTLEKIIEPMPPIANAGADISVEVGETLQFNASQSSDPDGSIVSYAWSNGLTGINPSYVYDSVGSYTVTLTVTDDSGMQASDSVVVTVTDISVGFDSTYPQANIRGTSNNWSPSEMTLVADYTWEISAYFGSTSNERFKFDIYGDWSTNFGDSNGDGTLEQAGGDIYITQGEGNYVIRFNDQNLTYTLQKQVGPQTPIANAGADISVAIGETVQFDASQSNDPDGNIVSYEWSNGLSGINPTFVYDTAGIYTITLTVTDDNGMQDSDSLSVTVADSTIDYQSVYSQVYFRGTANAWAASEMLLVADYTWEITASFGSAANERFKFDIYGDWSLNFGDNNGDGIAEQTGNDLLISQGAGDYRIQFNDQTRAYTITTLP